MKWTKEWPKKEGYYWFYGYRYGRISCGVETKKELALVKVREISSGPMYVCEGQFMYESEVEEPMFQKVKLPELP